MNDELSKHILLNTVMELLPKKELPDYREETLATLSDDNRMLGEIEENVILRKMLKQDKQIVLIHGCSMLVQARMKKVLEINDDQICNLRNYKLFGRGRRIFPIYHKSIFDKNWSGRYDFGIRLENDHSKTLKDIWKNYVKRKEELQKMVVEDKHLTEILETYNDVMTIINGGNKI